MGGPDFAQELLPLMNQAECGMPHARPACPFLPLSMRWNHQSSRLAPGSSFDFLWWNRVVLFSPTRRANFRRGGANHWFAAERRPSRRGKCVLWSARGHCLAASGEITSTNSAAHRLKASRQGLPRPINDQRQAAKPAAFLKRTDMDRSRRRLQIRASLRSGVEPAPGSAFATAHQGTTLKEYCGLKSDT